MEQKSMMHDIISEHCNQDKITEAWSEANNLFVCLPVTVQFDNENVIYFDITQSEHKTNLILY